MKNGTNCDIRNPALAERGRQRIEWASMGQEEEQKKREQDFAGYEVN